MATLLQDAFTGSNGTGLDAHSMDVGAGWTEAVGTWEIQSNAAKEVGVTAFSYAVAQAGQADVVITCDLVVPNFGGYASGITFRHVDTNNCWLMVLERDASGTPYMELLERTSGVQTSRAGGAGVKNVVGATNSTVGVTVTLSGTSITVTLSTGETMSFTSSAHQTATKHGLFSYTDGSYAAFFFDNFLVTGTAPGGATIYTVDGPTAGPVGAESATFTVTLDDDPTGTIVVTPAATGVTFTPSTLSFSGSTRVLTFTANAAAAGSKTISFSDDGGLTDPSSLGYLAKNTTTRVLTVQDGPAPPSVVGYQIKNLDGTAFNDRTTTGVTDQGDGVFSVSATVPDDLSAIVKWDADEDIFASADIPPLASGGGSGVFGSYVFGGR